MKVLFLDIDGVLNGNRRLDNDWFGIDADKCAILNRFLRTHPDVMIVISSAWKSMVYQGHMTVKGFELMLIACGLDCQGRVLACTRPSRGYGMDQRVEEIQEYIEGFKIKQYAVLDDLPLEITNLVQTNPMKGISIDNIVALKHIFNGG